MIPFIPPLIIRAIDDIRAHTLSLQFPENNNTDRLLAERGQYYFPLVLLDLVDQELPQELYPVVQPYLLVSLVFRARST
jgi:hypothetical protein